MTEFAAAFYDGVSNKEHLYQLIPASDLDEVVRTVEAFLQKLQTGAAVLGSSPQPG